MKVDAFKGNTAFLIPYIVKNKKLFLYEDLYEVTFDNILDTYFLKVIYKINKSNLEHWKEIKKLLKYEKQLYTVYEEIKDNTLYIVATYKFPELRRLLLQNIVLVKHNNLQSDVMIKNILYWRYNIADIIEHYEKSLATQSSSQALFLFNSSCFFGIKYTFYKFISIIFFVFIDMHNLIFKISIFRSRIHILFIHIMYCKQFKYCN